MKNSISVTKTKAVLKQKKATQWIDWQSNNVVLIHYTEKGGIIELQRVTQLSTATEVEPVNQSRIACVAVIPFPLTPAMQANREQGLKQNSAHAT